MSCAFSLCPLSPLLSKCLNIVHFLPVLPPFFCSPLCLISSFPWWNFAERHVCSCVTKGRNVALFFPASSLVWCICHSNKMQMESSERVCRSVAQWLRCVEKACSVCVLHCEPHALPWKNPCVIGVGDGLGVLISTPCPLLAMCSLQTWALLSTQH